MTDKLYDVAYECGDGQMRRYYKVVASASVMPYDNTRTHVLKMADGKISYMAPGWRNILMTPVNAE